MSLYTLHEKHKEDTYFIWKVMHQNIYMNDEKNPLDPQLLNDILWGLKTLCAKFATQKI